RESKYLERSLDRRRCTERLRGTPALSSAGTRRGSQSKNSSGPHEGGTPRARRRPGPQKTNPYLRAGKAGLCPSRQGQTESEDARLGRAPRGGGLNHIGGRRIGLEAHRLSEPRFDPAFLL